MNSETIESTASRKERQGYAVLWRETDHKILTEWWQSLQEDRGERARLRRCASPEDVLLQPAFHRLYQRFPYFDVQALAAVAGLVAHVKKLNNFSFPGQLGRAKEGSDKPVLSELRFQQLLSSGDLDEFYEGLRRAIMLLDREGNILSIADAILHWSKEQQDKNQYTERPDRRFQFSWAKAYFGEAFKLTENKKQGA